MYFPFRRTREMRRLLRLFISPSSSSANSYQLPRSYRQSRHFITLFSPPIDSFEDAHEKASKSLIGSGGLDRRFSTVSETSHESVPEGDLLPFIESTLDELEGPCHCWLNKDKAANHFSKRDGVFLIIAGAFSEGSGIRSVVNFDKVKSLQQRYPSLNVMGLQSSCSTFSDALHNHLLLITLRDYVTFPVLLSNKTFSEIADGVFYIFCKSLTDPLILYEEDVDLGTIDKAIKELNVQYIEKPSLAQKLAGTWVKPIEVFKEPNLCSPMKNLLLYFPGGIAADEINNRLFISDVNHHRIIVIDANGKILDCIGSSPGFEDGEFESSKLIRPAASFYHEDCLYFVDSENHAIRRADMVKRLVETIYPTFDHNRKSNSMWSWILNKLRMNKDVQRSEEEHDSKSFLFPWHLIKSQDNDLFIFNRSIETLWIMDMASRSIKEVIKGSPKILEICGELILGRSDLVRQVPSDWLKQHDLTNFSLGQITHAGLMSSVTAFQDHIIMCDTVGQMVRKFNTESGTISSLHLSNFDTLGLPYWLSFSLERVYEVGIGLSGVHIDHIQHFRPLPGRIDIRLNIDIPEDTELVEPLKEGSIWRQTRGTAAEITEAISKGESIEKVGVAQQFYNDLDGLATLTQEVELTEDDNTTSSEKVEDGRVSIDCAVISSPGTCELIIYSALYLRMKRSQNSSKEAWEKQLTRLGHHLNPGTNESVAAHRCIQFLSTSNVDPGEVVFVRPLHVRLLFDCLDHPKAKNERDIIVTDSSLEVNVTLT